VELSRSIALSAVIVLIYIFSAASPRDLYEVLQFFLIVWDSSARVAGLKTSR